MFRRVRRDYRFWHNDVRHKAHSYKFHRKMAQRSTSHYASKLDKYNLMITHLKSAHSMIL